MYIILHTIGRTLTSKLHTTDGLSQQRDNN